MERQQTGAGEPQGSEVRPVDRHLEVLADEDRRAVVEHLRGATAPVAVSDLAKRIADRESIRSHEAGPNRGKEVLVTLRHCHVPKLAEADVVEYDRDRNTVEPGADFERVADLLDALTDALDSPRE